MQVDYFQFYKHLKQYRPDCDDLYHGEIGGAWYWAFKINGRTYVRINIYSSIGVEIDLNINTKEYFFIY